METIKSKTQLYLEQLGNLDCQIKTSIAEAQKLRSLADKTTTSFSFNKSFGGETHDRMADAVATLVDLAEEVNDCVFQLTKLKRKITAQIEKLPDPELRMLLRLRYVYCLTMEKVAANMYFSVQWIYVLQGRALEMFDRVIPEAERSEFIVVLGKPIGISESEKTVDGN